ncbi:AraC family transcriptional regulator [Phormidium sp. FACHB-1136]|uniref:AraC family transcriptional regulator n=1 Tax=Phormidium sp. FACHB-1136 TaxID=2692848 RepID=UPI001686B29B|nr:AraC family transcriptional regulator [Phormidium sp. FACHB-1136]MBD2425691.1 AraC family transcriptional regulator ligand-binding domain-containing protein [Phormidium sp. FACHB-1136]
MDSIPLIRTAILLRFTDFSDQIGAPTERWLDQANLSPVLLTNPERLIPMVQSAIFAEQVARAEGIDNFGFLIGQSTNLTHLGQFGAMIRCSLTLYDLLTTIEKTINLLNSGERVSLRWSTDALWLQSHLYALDHQAHSQAQCFSIMAYLNVLRMALGPTWQPPEVHLTTQHNPALLDCNGLEGVRISFNQPCNAIKIPREFVSQPLHPSSTVPGQFEVLHQSAPALDFLPSLKQLIESLLPQGGPNIAQAAGASGMSVRSFQRRLANHGVSYGHLVDEVRFHLAAQWLKGESAPITDIAAELGYTDTANFTRAFKRWAGVSPREFRATHQGSG